VLAAILEHDPEPATRSFTVEDTRTSVPATRPRSLLEDRLGHCVTQAAAEGGDVADAKVREASEAIARLVGS